MKNQVIEAIEKNKIIVIVRGVEKENIIPLAEAMYNGGIRLIEFTYDPKGKLSDEENAANIEMAHNHFRGEMYVGAGTVLSEKQVLLTKQAGGRFIISPDTNPEVITATTKSGLVSIPGALTPTEVVAAHRCGADFVKLFPVGSLGKNYIKDISAPLSHIKLLAVGGVDVNNINEFFESGACGVGIGSGIVNKKLIASKDFEALTALARSYVEKI